MLLQTAWLISVARLVRAILLQESLLTQGKFAGIVTLGKKITNGAKLINIYLFICKNPPILK